MITFTSIEYDPLGVLQVLPGNNSVLDLRERRIASTPTLDGDRVFEDRGYTDSDRELSIVETSPKEETHKRSNRMMEYYNTMRMYSDEGVFMVSIKSVNYRNDTLSIGVLVQRKEPGVLL